MELFDDRVVLFESDEGGEYLLVTCEPSGMGGLVLRQTSEGPLTQWCFEESPHVVETFVTHEGACGAGALLWSWDFQPGRAHAEHLVCRL